MFTICLVSQFLDLHKNTLHFFARIAYSSFVFTLAACMDSQFLGRKKKTSNLTLHSSAGMLIELFSRVYYLFGFSIFV